MASENKPTGNARNRRKTKDSVPKIPKQVGSGSPALSPVAAEGAQHERPSPMSVWSRAISVGKYMLLLLLLPPFLNYASLAKEQAHLLPQGALYDIGWGQKMFLGCAGEGFPTVILDAPTGMSSDVWVAVQESLAKTTKVCVYDRAGLGFSERPHVNNSEPNADEDHTQTNHNRWQEYTVERMADDLHRLVSVSSEQQKPFIYVGSEIGALISRFYTQMYDTDVSDLVLIDPLVEDIFLQDNNIWSHFWFQHLVPSFQSMQLSAAAGVTRVLLLVGLLEQPISGEHISEEVHKRQKHLMCNPRHLSTVVDEHHFINDTFSQMQTIKKLKRFPQNVTVTVINGNYYDEQLPSALNKAWAKSQQNLISQYQPGSHHIVVNGADHRMLYKKPQAIVEPIKRLIKQRRANRQ